MLMMLRQMPHRLRAWFRRDAVGRIQAGPVGQQHDDDPSVAVTAGADDHSADAQISSRQPDDGVARTGPEMFARTDYRVWLVEQDVTRLGGEYVTETMILAPTEAEALEAAYALADPVYGFGLVVQRHRLRAVDYGPAPQPLPAVFPRFQHQSGLVLVVGTGSDQC